MHVDSPDYDFMKNFSTTRNIMEVHNKTARVMCIYFSNVSLDVSFSLAAEIVAFRTLR